ncbi:MAG: transcriptional repressor LexA [Candidatus Promineifilaceae bacterium]|nr:transcriptional repressor LexA [Candidatus Promineifilaceae bacterium]
MSDPTDLSTNQRNILEFVSQYIQRKGRPPTIREIGEATDISSTSVVTYNLSKLREKGLVDREPDVSRGLRLTERAEELFGLAVEQLSNMVRIPMAGDIVASEPVEIGSADTNLGYDEEDAVELSRSMLDAPRTDDLFALRVRGDSMIDAMVNDGDIVIMRQQTTARNGEMVAVWLTPSDTTTLKYFYYEGDQIRLQPANPTMDAIYVEPAEVTVQGKVMMVLRNTS